MSYSVRRMCALKMNGLLWSLKEPIYKYTSLELNAVRCRVSGLCMQMPALGVTLFRKDINKARYHCFGRLCEIQLSLFSSNRVATQLTGILD